MSNPRGKNVGGRCAGRKGKLLFSGFAELTIDN